MTEEAKTDNVMKLVVHPGIGDIGWLISKLATTGEQFDLVIAEDSKTKRSMPLVDMIPCIRSAEYGGLEIYHALLKCGNALWTEYKQAHVEGKTLYMSINKWLEDGYRIEGFLPDLDTDYHYPIHIPALDEEWAERVTDIPDKAFGIYTSSAGGIANWKAWTDLEWLDFIRRVHANFPITTFFLIGARWDMDMRLPMRQALDREHIPYVDLVGQTSLARAVALIKNLDYFAGFASGLTILADVVYKPCLMLYPDHLDKMMTAWPDPAHLADGTHQAHLWERPVRIFNQVKHQLDKYLGG